MTSGEMRKASADVSAVRGSSQNIKRVADKVACRVGQFDDQFTAFLQDNRGCLVYAATASAATRASTSGSPLNHFDPCQS
jgi:hypothetical protein